MNNTPLSLPEGAQEGCLLAVTWPDSESAKVVPGTYEGRLLKISGNQIIVKFVYEPDYFIKEEQIVIDLSAGLDLKYKAAVASVELVARHLGPSTHI